MGKINSILVVLLFAIKLQGQEEVKVKYGDVTPAHLSKKSYEIDANADAVVLYDKGTMQFEGTSDGRLVFEFEHHRRIHILTNKKFELATHEVMCYTPTKTDAEKLYDIEATTYNLEDGKVVKSKMGDDAVFHIKRSKYTTQHKFTLPNVKEGSIIEYKYKVKSMYIYNLRDWEFQSEIPTLWSELVATFPEFYKYVNSAQGFNTFYIKTQRKVDANYRINVADSPSDPNDWRNIDSAADEYRWVMKDIKGLNEEPLSTTVNNYISKIFFQLSEITYPFRSRTINNSSGKLNKEMLEDEEFKDVFDNDQKNAKQLVNDIIGTASLTEEEKAKKIYTHIRDEFTSDNDTWGIRFNKKIKDIIESKAGSHSDINLLLVSCLKNAGLNASPVILSLRDRGFVNPYYPLTDKFNYVIAKVDINGKSIFLDPASKKLGFGKLNASCLNGYARVVENNGTAIMISPDSIKEKSTSLLKMSVKDNALLINYQVKENWHNSVLWRKESDENKIIESYKKKLVPEAIISNEKVENFKNKEDVLLITMDINLPVEMDSLVYIPLGHFASNNQNPFTDKNRYLPIEYPYLVEDAYNVAFTIPEGYKIEELPKSEAFSTDDFGSFQFEFRCSATNNNVSIRSKIKINRSQFLQEEYESLKETYNLIAKKHNEQIVLRKI